MDLLHGDNVLINSVFYLQSEVSNTRVFNIQTKYDYDMMDRDDHVDSKMIVKLLKWLKTNETVLIDLLYLPAICSSVSWSA